MSSSRFLAFSFAIGYTSTSWLRASAGVSYGKGEQRVQRSSMSGSGLLAARASFERGRYATNLAYRRDDAECAVHQYDNARPSTNGDFVRPLTSAKAKHSSLRGHSSHFGFFGVQTVAPSSISAWFHAPGLLRPPTDPSGLGSSSVA